MTPEDDPGYGRQTEFNRGLLHLAGTHWTTSHFMPKGSPPAHIQVAWPWRREVWYAYFLCRRAIGQAHYRYTAQVYSTWSSAQVKLERLYHCAAAHAFHNALEDRLAQLANAYGNLGIPDDRVDFNRVFDKTGVPGLPETWAKAEFVRRHPAWRATHDLANELKHRWTGKLATHEPHPSHVRSDLTKSGASYICYGLTERTPEQIDEVSSTLQRSFNLLVELAAILDEEIGWDQYFHIAGREDGDEVAQRPSQ